ncbi:MAG: SPFH domain-containing protein, partial [Butyrivibrio sp.]|nr:SPFH domain-containing protein [Butyrivibrio sp.]
MGLLQAALVAGGSVLSDQWRDYFYCPSLSSDVLLTKGVKKAGKGNDNIISNGSIIAVNEGQCM